MTYGGQSVGAFDESIPQRQPLAVDKSLERELLHPLALPDILLRHETVERRGLAEVNNGLRSLYLYLSLFSKVGPEHLVNHLLKGDASKTVGGMDAAVRRYGEVEQQGGVAAHRFIIGVHQFRQTLHMLVLRLVVEPPGTYAGVRLAGTPHVAVLHTVVQHVPRGVALAGHHAPVGLAHVARLGAHPAQVAAVAAVVPYYGLGLQFTNHAERLGPPVIGLAVDAPRLVGAAVPSVAAVGAVEPHLEDIAVVRQQFAQLITEICHIFRFSVVRMVTVPGREINGKLQSLLAAGVSQFAHHVALAVLPGGVLHRIFCVF